MLQLKNEDSRSGRFLVVSYFVRVVSSSSRFRYRFQMGIIKIVLGHHFQFSSSIFGTFQLSAKEKNKKINSVQISTFYAEASCIIMVWPFATILRVT